MIVTRFPPSPTGYLHIGGVRTALYCWLHARQHNGEFVLRIEDTDQQRSTDESVQAILDGMQWLGLTHDKGPFYQTRRTDRYQEVIAELTSDGQAYYCECSKARLDELRARQKAAGEKPRYDGRCRNLELSRTANTVVRFKNPDHGVVQINDLVKGDISIANAELDDLIIARSDGMPTYNLCVVVDDMDMGISHVIRGDDHISNTPRQINILKALNASIPAYAHVPMILGEDGTRMSKRHGAVSIMQYQADGFLPEALLSYLARLGWSHGDQELFSVDELLSLFDIEKVSRSASTFDAEKLLWVNQAFLRKLSPQDLLDKARPFFVERGIDLAIDRLPDKNYPLKVISLIQERCKTLLDVVQQSAWFFSQTVDYDETQVSKHIQPQSIQILSSLSEKLTRLDDWHGESIHGAVTQVVKQFEVGFAKVAQPARIAVSGATNSPAIDQTLWVLGKETTLSRINRAVQVFAVTQLD